MQVSSGEGWRLEHDPARHPFVVLIGAGSAAGVGWAAELTAAEAAALRGGVARLLDQHAALVPQLMEEEAIALELEVPCATGTLWLELEGDRRRWRLRFVLAAAAPARSLEGGWDAEAAAALAAALLTLPLQAGGESLADSP